MRIELEVQVRGGRRCLVWHDGELTGDDEVRRRLSSLIDLGRVDLDDLVSVVRGVEAVTAQHVALANLEWTEPVEAAPAAALSSRPTSRPTSLAG